jgi:hypothetical protein
MWRDKIIAREDGEIEEVSRRFHADGMLANIFHARAAIAVAKKSCHRIAATAL